MNHQMMSGSQQDLSEMPSSPPLPPVQRFVALHELVSTHTMNATRLGDLAMLVADSTPRFAQARRLVGHVSLGCVAFVIAMVCG